MKYALPFYAKTNNAYTFENSAEIHCAIAEYEHMMATPVQKSLKVYLHSHLRIKTLIKPLNFVCLKKNKNQLSIT